ncbi:MFS transporter [Candidatus Magnetomonas plexicatena]|uniref:MFS transporter n=1 Tax=Candidatus Magnetomonas plexicatena TaxID=2552947 RepID=UPI001C74C4B7|nr:MFS transporter [Nitrospirales bacterium LBB_01]
MKKKEIWSWCLFDFANSGYSAVILTVVFPVYYTQVVVGNQAGAGDLWWGRAIALSMALVALTSPVLGGIADYGGLRKRFLFIYTITCVSAVGFFCVLAPGMIITGFLLIVTANIGFEGGIMFYNSYLPEIAPKEFHGRVSAWGFALGYVGSFISLLIVLPLAKSSSFNAIWISVAAFFFLFSLPLFIFLPKDTQLRPLREAVSKKLTGFLKTAKEIWENTQLRKFLISYFIYEDGTNTVIVFSSIFASATLGFKSEELIYLFLTVQITAFLGAMIMAKPIDVKGPKTVVVFSLVLWSAVTIASYFVKTKLAFFVVAVAAGFGLGTVQSASRTFFTEFIPYGSESEYFGFYSTIGKTSAVLGPLVFGGISHLTGDQRPAILSIIAFFITGLVMLLFVKGKKVNCLCP